MNERAKQFMPFAALRGYYDMIRSGSAYIEPKRELSDEQLDALNAVAHELKKGDLVSVVFYENYAYLCVDDTISFFSPEIGQLKVGKKTIKFADILELKILRKKQASEY